MVLLSVVLVISLSSGSEYIPLSVFWIDEQSHSLKEIIYTLRLPRAINAITVGALLSLAGLLIQNLVKNPLADPYILGISGASAFIQLLIIASGFILPLWLFILCGFVASILSIVLLITISSRNGLKTNNLLLTGVVIAFAYGAMISLILSISPLSTTKSMLFWLMGDLSFSQLSFLPLILLIIGSLWVFRFHKELDIMARGDLFAKKCGVDVKSINLTLLITASVFTAIAVSMAGTIGFVGLVVPHIARLLVGNCHAHLIPISAIIGAVVLLIADTVSRTILAPIQLPVGIFTALFGVPLFLYLMTKRT